jgi:pre-mRNA-splicing factor 18
MQSRSYQKANDAYLRLSIGNAAWPLGVKSIGMHERSSDNKIAENVAHVLNDEVSRKYIQAVKRLLTFSQKVRPPNVISQAMG